MNLRQALYVKTIADEGGITAAAKKLYISQPSLSQMLRQIEEETGAPLFDRSSLPIRPTYAGERYLHAAAVLLNTNEMLENELREIRGEERGRMRLGISMLRSAQLLPHVLPEFTSRFPKVEIVLQEAGSAKLEQLLQEGSVDLALASTEPNNPLLEYRLIQEERIGILAGPGSSLSRRFPSGTAISLKEAGDGRFVALKAGHSVRVIQDRLFQEYGLHPEFFLETDNMEAAQQIALRCGCYLLYPDGYLPAGAFFYPLEGYESRRHFYACLRKREHVPQYVVTLLHLIGQFASEGASRLNAEK